MCFVKGLLVILGYTAILTASPTRTLYNSLDPTSLSQHLAFYDLYPETQEGKQALQDVWRLLSGKRANSEKTLKRLPFSHTVIQTLVNVVNKQPDEETPLLTDEELELVDRLAQQLSNRKLKGSKARTEGEVLALAPEEVDLSRGLFLTQFGDDDTSFRKVRSYEAVLDLMALQLLARVNLNSTPQEKIRAINQMIFDEMRFRFPPHSLYANDVDLYTFLPSVLDSREGVCLGVSLLYLCLAQRLDLTLHPITPPGHIFIRWIEGQEEINIETTARGIHLDSEEYLGIDTRKLPQKTIKETIGMVYINQASVFLRQHRYDAALISYKKAEPYLPQDLQLKELMGYCFHLCGEKEEGTRLLQETRDVIPEWCVAPDTMSGDFLDGKVDCEGIKTLFLPVDERRDSILKKKEALERVLQKHPCFRQGWMALGVSWLQLHRTKEGLHAFSQYHALDPSNPEVEYYLALLHAHRLHYPQAWEHLKNAERVTKGRNHYPKALKQLRKELATIYPE